MSKVIISKFDEIETALFDIGKCEANVAEQEAKMNSEIMGVQDRYAETTKDDREKAESIRGAIESFCRTNIDEFADPRTKEYIHGKVSFRKNPPKVLQLNKKIKVEATVELIKKVWRRVKAQYLRVKEEVDKEMILSSYVDKKAAKEMTQADLKGKLTDEKLAEVGLRIEQDETFNLEINWDSLQ